MRDPCVLTVGVTNNQNHGSKRVWSFVAPRTDPNGTKQISSRQIWRPQCTGAKMPAAEHGVSKSGGFFSRAMGCFGSRGEALSFRVARVEGRTLLDLVFYEGEGYSR